LVQPPLHIDWPPEHPPPRHAPVMHDEPEAQRLPQKPQLLLSLLVSTHVPLQLINGVLHVGGESMTMTT
jgi:hypothetical protein